MAPPPKRRPGFSRRAQYSLFAAYVVAVLGALLGLLLLLAARFDPVGYAALRGVVLDATTPISAGGREAVDGVREGGSAIGAYFMAASQNRAMRAELERSREALVEARAIEFENRRLKRLLALSEQRPERIAAARLVGSTSATARSFATLTAGRAQGVVPGQPVRAAEGLVGRVIEAGRWSSRVLLLTDAGNVVPVRVARDGNPALVSGLGDGRLEAKPLLPGARPFRRGDILVTSGTGGLYGPNVPVAVVTQANDDRAIAYPLANPARVDFAIVEAAYLPPETPAAGAAPAAATPAGTAP